MTTAFEHEDLVKELLIDIDENLESQSAPGQCCIYRVPKDICRVNEEVYTPQLISVGPFHHGKQELADMEKKKKQYVKSFIRRTTIEKIDKIPSFIRDREKQIRACYAETSTLESIEFVRMIFYDSIFIIEIFLTEKSHDKRDILLDTKPTKIILAADLLLFENQLPYFILEEIYRLAFDSMHEPTFMDLSINFFGFVMGEKLCRLTPEVEVKHFTDWRRISLLGSYQPVPSEKGVSDLPCAVQLHESGIKFKRMIKQEQSLLDIKFEKRKRLIPFLEVHELQIPQLMVDDETERLLRNVIALEQCVYPNNALVSNYVDLMDCLINTEKDVDLLVGSQIVANFMGDNASVANMFNKLYQNVPISPSSYHHICKQLKQHYKNPWNRTKATLKRVYFNNLWRGTATVAAIILLLLTIVQTVCSILQVM